MVQELQELSLLLPTSLFNTLLDLTQNSSVFLKKVLFTLSVYFFPEQKNKNRKRANQTKLDWSHSVNIHFLHGKNSPFVFLLLSRFISNT